MNATGFLVLVLLLLSLVCAGVAAAHGNFDGAALLAAVTFALALAITVWAAVNRKRTHR